MAWLAVMTLCVQAPAQTATTPAWVDFSASTEEAWEDFENWKSTAKNDLVVFPPDSNRALFTLYESGIDSTSMLAAFILHTGGMLVDHGWLRVLGSGCQDFSRGFKDWNNGKNTPDKNNSRFVFIADDVVGGFFALKMAPDTRIEKAIVWFYGSNNLQWVSTGITYSSFLRFCMSGDIAGFYSDFRWKGWEAEVNHYNPRHTISCYPLLWTKEGKDLKVNRKVVDVATVWNNYHARKK